jgi:hypothetical protein
MRLELTDNFGNKLYFQGNRVFIALKGEGHSKQIGEVIGDCFVTRRDLDRHEMHNRKEIGFNLSLMKYGRFSNVVVMTTEGTRLETTRRWIMKYGKVNRPGGRRYELQIFLPVDKFCGFVEPPPEEVRRPETQMGLFQ